MLEGTLESFALPDVFQLLALTKKTGTLRLRRSGGEGRVLLQDGQVVFAGSSSDRLALGRRLVGAGLLSTEGLREALEQQRRSREAGEGTRIGRILVELGEIDEDTLETFVREQIQDAVFDLMRWPDGSFSFEEQAADLAQEPIQLAVSVENLIMEGSRRLEEWEQVRRKIPDLDAVVGMAPMRSDDDTVDVNLQPDEWRLLTVVDGRRTVRELVDLFGQGEFHLCRILYGMVASGLLVVQQSGEDGGPASDLLAQRQLLRELEEAAERAASDTSDPAPPTEHRPQADAPAAPPPAEVSSQRPVAPPPTDAAASERPLPPRPQARPAGAPSPASPAGSPEPSAPRPAEGPTAAVEPQADTQRADRPRSTERPTLTADPELSADLVQRLIDGVKEL